MKMNTQRSIKNSCLRNLESTIRYANSKGFRIVNLYQVQKGLDIEGWCCKVSSIRLWGDGVWYTGTAITARVAIVRAVKVGIAKKQEMQKVLYESLQ